MQSYYVTCPKVSEVRQPINGIFPLTCHLRGNVHQTPSFWLSKSDRGSHTKMKEMDNGIPLYLLCVFQHQNLPYRQTTFFRLFLQVHVRPQETLSDLWYSQISITGSVFIFSQLVSLKIWKISSCYSTKLSTVLGKERAFVRDSRESHLQK